MKKLIALLLALMMVMVSVAALAGGLDEETTPAEETLPEPIPNAGEGTPTNYAKGTDYKLTATAKQTIVLPKVYTVTLPTGQKAEKSLPSDTVAFTQSDSKVAYTSTVTAAPDLEGVTMDAIVEGENGLPNDQGKYSYDVTIELPSYTGVGVYTYTLTETDNGVAGVTYIGNIELKVTVVQNGDNLQIAGIALRKVADGGDDAIAETKLDKFENTYKAGSLTVTKTVDGTMGDRSKKFPIDVVFTAPSDKKVTGTITYYAGETEKGTVAPGEEGWTGSKTVSLELAHGETIQFDNIPDGVKYTVIEDPDTIKHLTSETEEQDKPNSYKVAGEVTSATAITAGSVTPVTITNTKDIDVDTGITLETLPYVLLMALAAMGFVALKLRKREEY